MSVAVIAEMSSTDLNKTSGKVLDMAFEGPVRVTRRNQRFVVMTEDTLENLLEAARDNWPQSLEDLLQDYDKDKIRRLAGGFLSDPPVGKEIL